MRTRTALLVNLGLTLIAWLYGLYRATTLPDRIPTHWNIHGEVDGWGSKTFVLAFCPLMMLAMILLIVVLPRISPRQYAIASFSATFNEIMTMIVVLFGYIQVVSLEAAANPKLDTGKWIISGLFLLFAMMGNLMGKVRQNYWMGIRVPWTLSSVQVWDQTHRFAGRLWVGTSALGLVLVLAGAPVWIAMTIFLASAFLPIAYSYQAWVRLGRP